MKKLGENLYSQTVVFDLVRFDNRKELVKKSIEKDECIKELLKTNMLFGESWFTKKYQSEEFKSGGLVRINTVNLSNAAIKIESITYIENGYKFGCKVKFSIVPELKEFLEKEILNLNYYLEPRIIINRKNGIISQLRIITFDLIGGTKDRKVKENN